VRSTSFKTLNFKYEKSDIACIIDDDPIFCLNKKKKIMQLADFRNLWSFVMEKKPTN
jgi:hypothetical protein